MMRRSNLLRAFAPVLLAAAMWQAPAFAETAITIPAPAVDAPASDGMQTVVLAGGCFWGVQAVYQHTQGVTRAISGYAGGTQGTATYDVVSSGRTGHAEAVEVTFDPRQVSYGKILQIYFSVAHDPTQLNRQGPDSGTQYRSEIFYKDDAQKKVAETYITQLDAAKSYRRPIVTKVEKLEAFYPAEDYHQDYAHLHPNNPYIFINDAPKVEQLKKIFADAYRDKPALVRSAEK
jgi:peptide-methionine (S)-S-oxide reductase